MTREYEVVIERDENGTYVASVPSLPGCHTQAGSLDELIERVQEVIELCLEEQVPPEEPLEFAGVQRVSIAYRAQPPLQETPSTTDSE